MHLKELPLLGLVSGYTLRYARENNLAFFGGINIVKLHVVNVLIMCLRIILRQLGLVLEARNGDGLGPF